MKGMNPFSLPQISAHCATDVFHGSSRFPCTCSVPASTTPHATREISFAVLVLTDIRRYAIGVDGMLDQDQDPKATERLREAASRGDRPQEHG